MNPEEPDQPSEDESWPPQRDRRSLLLRITAACVLVIMVVYLAGTTLDILQRLPFDFLEQSRSLEENAEIQQWQQTVVQVEARSDRGTIRSGTGFNIRSDGLIVTNRHVTRGAREVLIRFAGDGTFRVKEWNEHPSADLALISLEDHDRTGLPTVGLDMQTVAQTGDPVTVIGNPFVFNRVVMRGTLLGYTPVPGLNQPLLEIEVPIQEGSSGSPVFNREGRVIAIIFARVESKEEETPRRGLAIPVRALRYFSDIP